MVAEKGENENPGLQANKLPLLVTLNLFQGLNSATLKIKMLKQVQHDGLVECRSLELPLKAAFALLLILLPLSAHAAAPITGRWVTQSKDGIVEIYQCGAQICGRLAKFLVMPPAGAGAKDINNPNKALRSRTILGMNILTGFTEKGNEWKGQIYDPKSGKTYRSVVYKGKSGNLVVKGCIGPFCQAQAWTPSR